MENMKDPEHDVRFRLFHPAVLILVSAAALLRLALSLHFPRAVKDDESAYLLLGYNLFAGNGFTQAGDPELHFAPLQPFLVGFLSLWTGDLEMASNVENAVFGGLLLLPVFAMALRIYGRETAWLAAILLALFPSLTVGVLYWGSMSEPPFLFLLFLSVALILAGLDDRKPWMLFAAGGTLGAAYLIRPEAIAFCGALSFVALLWRRRTDAKSSALRIWNPIALFVLAFIFVAVPYIWYLHVHTGQWMVSGKLNVSWKAGSGYGDKGRSLDEMYNGLDSSGVTVRWLSSERFREDLLSKVVADPMDVLRRVIRHAGSLKENFFSRTNFWWPLTLLLVLGLFKQPWCPRRLRYEVFLMTIILVLLVVFLPFGFLVRYFAPAIPVLLMWSARGALELGRWLQETVMLCRKSIVSNRYVKTGLGWLPAWMAIVSLVATIPVTADRAISTMNLGDKDAGLWLKAHTPNDAKVMAHDAAVAVYARRGWIPSPHTDWDRFLKYAAIHGASYLVVRDYLLEDYHPELASVVRNGATELELVHSFKEPYRPQPIRTFIYRFVRPYPTDRIDGRLH